MATNSCTSKSSAPEEFWNCADITVSDSNGEMGPDVSFDNAALVSMTVENLVPSISSGELMGVYATCPEDAMGQLLGVGSSEDYEGLCVSGNGEALGNCKDLSSSGASSSSVCNTVPASGIICDSQCGDWWYQCAHGVPMMKPVPTGTKCKDNNFVVNAVCAAYEPEPEPQPEPEPEATPAPTPAATPAPTPAPTTAAPATTTVAPTPTTAAPTTAAPTVAPTPSPAPVSSTCVDVQGTECSHCMASNNVCYAQPKAWCDTFSYRWCGATSLLQEEASVAPRKRARAQGFLAPSLR